jgi:hypothetical protein
MGRIDMFNSKSTYESWIDLLILSRTGGLHAFCDLLRSVLPAARESQDELRLLYYIGVNMSRRHYGLALVVCKQSDAVFTPENGDRLDVYHEAIQRYAVYDGGLSRRYLVTYFSACRDSPQGHCDRIKLRAATPPDT